MVVSKNSTLYKIFSDAITEVLEVIKFMSDIDIEGKLKDVKIVDISKIDQFLGYEAVEEVIAVISKFYGDTNGYIMLLADYESTMNIIKKTVNKWITKEEAIKEGEDVIKEISNIVFGKIAKEMSLKLGRVFFSVPIVRFEPLVAIVESIIAEIGMGTDKAVIVNYEFKGTGLTNFTIMVFLDKNTIEVLLN